MSTPSWVPIAEASDRYSLHPDTIRRMISRGEIEAKRFGPKAIRVNLESLERAGQPLSIEEYAQRLAETAPPLTPEQRTRLAAIFRSGDAA